MANAQILRAARARIADELHWTPWNLARDETGRAVSPKSPRAVCWCAFGALGAEGSNLDSIEAQALRKAAAKLFKTESAGYVNDVLGHAAVLAMYDAAIAAAEAGV